MMRDKLFISTYDNRSQNVERTNVVLITLDHNLQIRPHVVTALSRDPRPVDAVHRADGVLLDEGSVSKEFLQHTRLSVRVTLKDQKHN
jgi:hypothetical protein